MKLGFIFAISAFSITSDYHCGGKDINKWSDGTSSEYGTVRDLSDCKMTCFLHAECSGFVYSVKDNGNTAGVCGHWKQGPLAPYQSNDYICYEKQHSGKK